MKHAILLSCCLVLTLASGQKYNFRNFTVEDGLAQSQINDINQDELGYLWIATEVGLSRFDGLSFYNYSIDDGLPDNTIEKLYIDPDGVLWVGTPKGIAHFVDDQFESHFFDDTYRVNDLEMFQGKLYVATSSYFLCFEKQNFQSVDLGQPEFRTLCNYNDSILYCAGKDGVQSWNGSEFQITNDSLLNYNVSQIERRESNLIISTYGAGLISYAITTGKISRYETNLERIRSIFVNDKIILCATLNGAIELSANDHEYFKESNGLIYENLRCVFIDNEDNYWFGSNGKGLFRFLGKSIVSYSTTEGLNSNLVMSISQRKDGSYIFGTFDSGISVLLKDSIRAVPFNKGKLPSNSVWDTHVSEDGSLWLATSKGIACYKGDQPVLESITKTISEKIRCITPFDNKLLFGGTNGIYSYDGSEISFINGTESFNVNQICADEQTVFVASRDGLYRSNDTALSSFEKITSKEESINSLTFDQFGNLWVGTNNGLKVFFDQQIMVPFGLDQSDFKSKAIYGLVHSKEGDIWVSTINGVYQIILESEQRNSFKINHYATPEGVINLESNLNALYEDEKGRIWVGTADGLLRINPQLNGQLFDFRNPQLHLTGMRLFMEEFDYNRFDVSYEGEAAIPTSISLPHDQNHLTFDFIGINLKNPESVLYQYRLVGSNNSWSPLSPARYATYSDVTPGEYDFEVRATNKSFEWSSIKSIHIVIRPPYWKTWWFFIIILVVSISIVLIFFRARIRSIKQKQENEKLGYRNRLLFLEQQSLNASMNRHFIFNSLNSIQYFINSSDKLSANKYLSSFAKLIRKNLDSSTNDNFIVTLQEEIDRIELYLTLEKMRFQEKFDYQLNVSSSLDTESTEIPSMILQPFVENSIIHGVLPLDRKGLIQINIFEEYGNVVFEVVDDGVGIDNTLKNKKENIAGDHESKGMEITSRRIELLRKLTGENLMIIGPFQINNEAGEAIGTKVVIKMTLHLDQ